MLFDLWSCTLVVSLCSAVAEGERLLSSPGKPLPLIQRSSTRISRLGTIPSCIYCHSNGASRGVAGIYGMNRLWPVWKGKTTKTSSKADTRKQTVKLNKENPPLSRCPPLSVRSRSHTFHSICGGPLSGASPLVSISI